MKKKDATPTVPTVTKAPQPAPIAQHTTPTVPSKAKDTTMSFLDLNLNDTWEPKTHEADKEVIMRVSSAKLGNKKDDLSAQRIEVVLSDPADDTVKDVYIYLTIPRADTDRKKANDMKNRIKDFYIWCGLDPMMPINIERDLEGKQGWVVLGVDDSAEFGTRNTVKRWVKSA